MDKLRDRENWFLSTFNPLLNEATSSYYIPSTDRSVSMKTISKISASLVGRVDTEETRAKKKSFTFRILKSFFRCRSWYLALG